MTKTPKISVKGLCKAFGDNEVLKSLDLDVGPGESVVIIGGSGTGKSVLVKCILGLLEADAGQILIDGEDMTNPRGKAYEGYLRRTGMLFQGAALFDSLSVADNVSFGLVQALGKTREEARGISLEKLKRVGLGEEVMNLYPAELSGGMKKRVGLARAIAAEPEMIFFDEPTTGLDPIMADVINSLITECVKDLGATTITITHDMSSVRKIADRAAMLHQGKIIWQGSLKEIHSTKNPFVTQFVSGSAVGPIKVAGLPHG